MLLLDAASKLQISSSNATISLDFTVSKVRNGSPFLPVPTKGNLSTAGPVDLCAVPGGTDVDTVEEISICNTHATNSTDVTVTHVGGTTVRVFKVVGLAPGESILWTESGVLFVYGVDGAVKSSNQPGRWLRTRRFTSGTSFNTSSDCNRFAATVIGGGGGGAGCTSLASAAAAGGGGGSGAKAEKTWDCTPGATINYTIGAGGAGNSGAAGSNGGATTITGPDAVVVTAPGGIGAPVATAATTLTARAGGDGGALATNGDHNKGGNPGTYGVVLIVATPILASGSGASGLYGDGGLGLVAAGAGNAATGNGAGGGGSATGASTARAGGAGSGGIIVVEEYS
jgi:hypothetical protein